jgi:Ser/Thr protein kinase RdoA (MazF antagonist)
VDQRTIEKIIRAYGYEPRTVLPSQKGYRNSSYPVELASGDFVNFILYKNEQGILTIIHRANQVANYLASVGLPVRRTRAHRIMTIRAENGARYGALYDYLPGRTIPWEAYAMNHIKLVGLAMSDMHDKLRQETFELDHVVDVYQPHAARMREYFTDSDVQNALRQKLGIEVMPTIFKRLEGILAIGRSFPSQPLHMDFVRGNLLFDEARSGDYFTLGNTSLTGIIDFEKVALGHPVFDIARTLAFLLVDCKYKSPEKIRKYFLQSGYNKLGDATFTLPIIGTADYRLDVLEELTSFFLFHDFYKFLKHNPYESLSGNEHFVRTRDILAGRKMLQYSKTR